MMKVSHYHSPLTLPGIAPKSALAPKADSPTTQKGGAVAAPAKTPVFEQEMSRALVFSKHAQQRMYSRRIDLSQETLSSMNDAVDKAAQKGAKETLILTSEAAFVVAVRNRTVVSAFDTTNLREGVFTAIDSAVILR